MLLAIDPGISTGWAIFSLTKLIDCGLGEDWPLTCWGAVQFEAIIELPEVYNPRFMKGDPNDLITLARRVGRYEERLILKGIPVEVVLPKTWKGQLDKDVHHARGRRRLSDSEKIILDQAEVPIGSLKAKLDVRDAVNLGLWKSGRLPKSGQAPPR